MPLEKLHAREIVAKGLGIYDARYRAEFEQRHHGKFAAVDINSEVVYLADLPESALSKARACSPEGVFYLLRVGWPAAFKSSGLVRATGSKLSSS
jgi:hypothetical protein